MPIEVAVSPPIPGAARTSDATFPAPNLQVFGTVSLNTTTWLDRQGYNTFDDGSQTAFGGAPLAGSGWTFYRGRQAWRCVANGVSGFFYRTGNFISPYFPTLAEGSLFNDDFRCWRIVSILAFDLGIGSGDTGLECGVANNYDIVVGTAPGFRIGPFSDTSFGLQIRQTAGGAFTYNQTILSNIDIRDWHAFELRLLGATRDADAAAQVFIDGVQLAAFDWGAGTILPTSFISGASCGMQVGIGNRGANGTYFAHNGTSIVSAAEPGGLL